MAHCEHIMRALSDHIIHLLIFLVAVTKSLAKEPCFAQEEIVCHCRKCILASTQVGYTVSAEVENGQEVRKNYKTSRPTSADPLPPAMVYFLQLPQASKIAPPTGEHVQTFELTGTFHIQTASSRRDTLPLVKGKVTEASSHRASKGHSIDMLLK